MIIAIDDYAITYHSMCCSSASWVPRYQYLTEANSGNNNPNVPIWHTLSSQLVKM